MFELIMMCFTVWAIFMSAHQLLPVNQYFEFLCPHLKATRALSFIHPTVCQFSSKNSRLVYIWLIWYIGLKHYQGLLYCVSTFQVRVGRQLWLKFPAVKFSWNISLLVFVGLIWCLGLNIIRVCCTISPTCLRLVCPSRGIWSHGNIFSMLFDIKRWFIHMSVFSSSCFFL